jgi:hypothetical protein
VPTIEVVILGKCQKEGGAWLYEGRHTCRRNHSVEPFSRQHGRLSGAQIINPQKPISHGQIGVKIFDRHCHLQPLHSSVIFYHLKRQMPRQSYRYVHPC